MQERFVLSKRICFLHMRIEILGFPFFPCETLNDSNVAESFICKRIARGEFILIEFRILLEAHDEQRNPNHERWHNHEENQCQFVRDDPENHETPNELNQIPKQNRNAVTRCALNHRGVTRDSTHELSALISIVEFDVLTQKRSEQFIAQRQHHSLAKEVE